MHCHCRRNVSVISHKWQMLRPFCHFVKPYVIMSKNEANSLTCQTDVSHLRLCITNYECGTWCCLIEDFKINKFGVDKIFLFYRLLFYRKTVYSHISSAPFAYKIYTCNG
jgi:hypothetical protein